MKKSKAIIFLGVVVVLIGCFAWWLLWEPAPVLQGIEDLESEEQGAVRDYLATHPPSKTPLSWDLLKGRALNPYKSREPGFFRVLELSYTDGSRTLYIAYPDNRQSVEFESLPDGTWQVADTSGKTPVIGRLFQ